MVVVGHSEIRWLLVVEVMLWNLLVNHHHVGGNLSVDGLEVITSKV